MGVGVSFGPSGLSFRLRRFLHRLIANIHPRIFPRRDLVHHARTRCREPRRHTICPPRWTTTATVLCSRERRFRRPLPCIKRGPWLLRPPGRSPRTSTMTPGRAAILTTNPLQSRPSGPRPSAPWLRGEPNSYLGQRASSNQRLPDGPMGMGARQFGDGALRRSPCEESCHGRRKADNRRGCGTNRSPGRRCGRRCRRRWNSGRGRGGHGEGRCAGRRAPSMADVSSRPGEAGFGRAPCRAS